MDIITDNNSLKELCQKLNKDPFVCIDTEFMREGTYWPRLCLIQLADPQGNTFVVDPLATNIDLGPFCSLLTNESLQKVLHAARQDMEIFFHLIGSVPKPLFDTQIAAMVCGFGEAASYETLVRKLAGAQIDKSSRFSDWSKRPLEKRQLSYALSDVAHLPEIYKKLHTTLTGTGRSSWVQEEMDALCNSDLYAAEPKDAWKKIKSRGAGARTLAVLRELATVREISARRHNIPRQRLLKDASLLEVASACPRNETQLARIRGLSEGTARGKLGSEILNAITRGLNIPQEERPRPQNHKENLPVSAPVVDLLKVLLKTKCEQHGVAQKLVAKNSELIQIAAGHDTVPALKGWRYHIFGSDALKLRDGILSLSINNGEVSMSPCESSVG